MAASQERAALEIGSILQTALAYRKSDLFKVLAVNCELHYHKLDMAEKLAEVLGAQRQREAKTAFRRIQTQARVAKVMSAINERLTHRLANYGREILQTAFLAFIQNVEEQMKF